MDYNFTQRARRVLALAHAEAERRGHAGMSPEHMALGLIEEGGGVAVAMLGNRGIPLDIVRRELEAHLPMPVPQHPALRDLPWTAAGKKVLERSREAAREFKHAYIGTQHLLVALLDDPTSASAQAFARHGLQRDSARAEMLRLGPMPPSN